MLWWQPYPFVRLVIYLISGIALGIIFGESSDSPFFAICGSFSLFFLYLISVFVFRRSTLNGFFGSLFIVIVGFIHTSIQIQSSDILKAKYAEIAIKSYPEKAGSRTRYKADILNFSKDGEEWFKSDLKCLVYFDSINELEYGQKVLIKADIYEIEGPKNPEEFDYRSFLYFKGITAQSFIRGDSFLLLPKESGFSVVGKAFEIRTWVERQIDLYFNDQEQGILKALVVGIKDDIDDDLKDAYAAAGAIHILAVSGLHVGIVYGVFLWVFGSLRKSRNGRWLFAILAVLVLWFYAFVTGFSPSILRAVLMFNFIILAQALNRGSNIYNAIAASAFLLLCYDPFLIMNVGFQLSYSAVIGIVFLYPKIVAWLEPGNIILDRIWQLTVVGVSAQLATLPLSLYYFHQFPTYFFISNLFAVPLAGIILSAGLIFLLSTFSAILAGIVSVVVSFLVKSTNYMINFINELPGSTVSGIYLTEMELILLSLALLGLIIGFSHRKIRFIYVFYSCVLLMVIININRLFQLHSEEFIQFYSIRGETVIDFFDGRSGFSWQKNHENDVRYQTENFRGSRYARLKPMPNDLHLAIKDNTLMRWKGVDVLVVTNDNTGLSQFEPDVLILENNSIEDFQILSDFSGLLVLATSNTKNFRKSMLSFAEKNLIKIHDLSEESLSIQIERGMDNKFNLNEE